MFFYIGQNCPLSSMQMVSEDIFLDKGWTTTQVQQTNYWYKGYSTECKISENIEKIIDGYKPKGKWTVISDDKTLFHDVIRPFPIYKNHSTNEFTNIPLEGFELTGYNHPNIVLDQDKISLAEASKEIGLVLESNIKNFFLYNNIDELNVLFSAGLDTLTVWAILDSLGYNYKLHIHLPTFQSNFGTRQEYDSDLINLCREKFWGYKMTSCFNDTNWYLTGFYSERFQIREVTQGHTIANYKKVKLHRLPKRTDYLYNFLQRPQCKVNNEPIFESELDVLDYCNKTIFYDHQMWHIDNNFHFSPFFDIRITQIVNKLSLDDLVHNALTGHIQKEIIKLYNIDFLQLLSDYKNEGDIWKNYRKNFDKIKLRPEIVIHKT